MIQMTRRASLTALLACLPFVVSTVRAQQLGAVEPRNAVEPMPPSSWQTRKDYLPTSVSRSVVLAPMPEFAADLSDGDESGGPLQIGVGRELPAADRVDLAATTAWTALPGGGRVASFSVRSPGAVAIRAAVTATLPEGAVLRFFGFGDSPGRYPVVKNDVEMRWSPTVPGDTIGIEIELPPLMHESEVSLRVVRVSHLYRSASSARDSNTDSCSRVEVACKMLPACPNGAVARTIVTYPSGVTGACTGTSVNSNRARDDNLDAPYFLTAAHCIASQAVADTLETRWFYQYDSCETPRDASDFIELHGGADIVEVDTDTDSTLLRLRDALPNNACLAGWNARVGWTAGTDVTSLHHADGDPKQWAGGRIGSTGFHSDDGRDLIEVVWNEGFTLGGSSGSGLFTTLDGNDVLIGVLSAGTQCVAGVGQLDSFGRFDRFYDNHAGAHLQHDDPPPEDDHGDRVAEATSVVLESEVAGEIDHGSDADVFEIVVVQKGTLTVYTTGSVDTVGRLKREDGSTVAYNDDADYPTNSNFRIEVAVTPGNYYVKVSGYNPGDVGGYRLHVGFTASGAVVPLFLAASRLEDVGRQGFVRVVNRSDRSGEVRIIATDDAGQSPGTVTLALDAGATRAFNSRDLEEGNADKDLSGRTGAGTGDWRLALDSQLDIEVQAFVRTTDGFLTAVHDLVAKAASGSHYVPVFNPASNVNQRSRLRLVNPDPDSAVDVEITGIDDAGDEGQRAVELELPAGSAVTLGSVELEEAFGDGHGKWRLFVNSDGEIHVVNLLDSVSGDLTNLSTGGSTNE